MTILHLLAQAAPTTHPTTSGGDPAPMWFKILNPQYVMVALMGIVFYFIMLRPRKQQDAQRNAMLQTLKRGDEIQTIGGIIGTVVEARENEVIVKVDETNNTKMKFARSAIKIVADPKAKDSK